MLEGWIVYEVKDKGDIRENKALDKAYKLGRSI